MKRLKITIHKLSKTMNWNKFLPCILFGSLLGACSGKGEQPKVEPDYTMPDGQPAENRIRRYRARL